MLQTDRSRQCVILPDLDERLATLEARLTASRLWQEPVLRAFDEAQLSRAEIREFMVQYYHYVRRFIGWIGLLLTHSDDDRIRFYLLPHLSDEINDRATRSSHRTLLMDLLVALGLDDQEIVASRPRPETARCERYFWDLYSTGRTLDGLFALGPGTEAVSCCFLEPMERGIRRAFNLPEEAYQYFEVHRPEVEQAHVEFLNDAIRHTISRVASVEEAERLWQRGASAAEEAVGVHQQIFRLMPAGCHEGSQ